MRFSTRPLDEHEHLRFVEMIDGFREKGGKPGFLLYATYRAQTSAAFLEARDRGARGALAAVRKPYRSKIIDLFPRVLGLNESIKSDEGITLLQPATLTDLENVLALAERRVELTFEGYPDRFFQRTGGPVSNHARYFLVPAIVPHLDRHGVKREWQWRWLTEWCRLIESVKTDWLKANLEGDARGLARDDADALKSFLKSFKLIRPWKNLNQGIKNWWMDTGRRTKNETARLLISRSVLDAYPAWQALLARPPSPKDRKAMAEDRRAHRTAAEKFVDDFDLTAYPA